MDVLYSLYSHQFIVFLLVLTRISGLVTAAPVWSSPVIPMRVRALLAVSLSLIIAPMVWHQGISHADDLLNLLVLVAGEFVVGLSLGLAVTIYFSGLQLAGQVIGQMSGMSLADVVSPTTRSPVPVFSQFLHMLMLVIFVVSGGLEQLLDAMFSMFHQMPPGQAHFSAPLLEALSDIAAISFQLGLRVAAPVMVALLLSIMIMGLVSRTLPQLNVLAVGFSLNSIIALSALLLSIGFLLQIFQPDQFFPLERILPVYSPAAP